MSSDEYDSDVDCGLEQFALQSPFRFKNTISKAVRKNYIEEVRSYLQINDEKRKHNLVRRYYNDGITSIDSTLLNIAAERGFLEIMNMLIEAGADIHDGSEDGSSISRESRSL